MKKLHLVLDDLKVESFSTLAGEKERGTVEGQRWSEQWNSNCCPESASVPVACICVSGEGMGTCDTTCNPYDCFTCDGGGTCGADCETVWCSEIC